MGAALQCPKCGATHPVDRHAGAATFTCAQCGQLLKVPPQFRPAVRGDTPADQTVGAAGGSTSVLPPQAVPPAAPRERRSRPRKPPTAWRVVAWVVAVLAGGVIVFAGGRVVGYLSGQRALDVVLERGLDRYVVLLPLVPIWAVVTTLLVTLLIEGGSALASRRRSAATPTEDPAPARRATEGRRTGRPQRPVGT